MSIPSAENINTFLKYWIIPPFIVIVGAYAIYIIGTIDISFDSANLFFTTPEDLYSSISNLIELNVAILGIVLTVVAIVVQLAAQRYTPKLVDLFLEDKFNRIFFIYLIIVLTVSVITVYAIKSDFKPIYSAFTLIILTILLIAFLLPYFNYVFRFLTPINIITQISINTERTIQTVINHPRQKKFQKHQKEVANALEQVSDIVLSSNTQMDRNVALLAINHLRNIVLFYQNKKQTLPEGWFVVEHSVFISISRDFYKEIIERKIWVEALFFMNMELIFKMSLNNMPDAISTIAYNTRFFSEKALAKQETENVKLSIEYFNTFMRLALNEKNQKAVYNIFYQYRTMTESFFNKEDKMVSNIIFYLKYYAQIAFQMGMWFILIIAAYDISYLCSKAYDVKVKNLLQIINLFLEMESIATVKSNPVAYKGVRKAQLVLCTYLYSQNDKKYVNIIVNNFFKRETFDSIRILKDEIVNIKSKKFWEITDRGINFEYIDDTQKNCLEELFTKFIEPQKEKFLS